ncbi:MAG: putative signal transduction protein [Proteobacteria bacterium]|nr:putative signal transduction protein [Pseudomonadota bacterium]
MPDVYISRQPLVNRQSKIIATRLTLHRVAGATTSDAAAALAALADFWPQGEKLVFINSGQTPCDAALLDWPLPANATIEVDSGSLSGPHAAPLIAALQAAQPSLCLRFDSQTPAALESGVSLRFIALDARCQTPAQLKSLALALQPHAIVLAFNVDDSAAFQACLAAGVNAAASWFFKKPTQAPGKALNSGQAQIIRVLNLVRKNGDIRDIEAALKQDVALSYKLLRYINSVGFGLSCEVQSFRHAVSILGYDKLNKWLSLLLVTASRDPMAPALMHTALTRARLMEVLAQGLVEKAEYDNLFITGAFSLLDVLLGVSMERVLESMSLPESISDALLGYGGVYGPFLDLARASENGDADLLAEQVALLGLSAGEFNRAQLQALAFADTMEL